LVRVSENVCVIYHTNIRLIPISNFANIYKYLAAGKISLPGLLLDSPACGVCCQVTETACWTIQEQPVDAKFEGWHHYGIQSNSWFVKLMSQKFDRLKIAYKKYSVAVCETENNIGCCELPKAIKIYHSQGTLV